MDKLMKITTVCFFFISTAVLLALMSDQAQAQGQTRWIQVGSLHN
jgi:cell division protein FtsW (lipid II flippase)